MKPKVFIGSSADSIKIAEAILYNLEFVAEVTPWSQGIFTISDTSLESLLSMIPTFDFGIFVFSPDDILIIHGESKQIPRDNVIFELGLFIGSLGKERCFIVAPRDVSSLRLPTDLLGFTPATYESNRSDENWKAALTYACIDIKESIKRLGKRKDSVSFITYGHNE